MKILNNLKPIIMSQELATIQKIQTGEIMSIAKAFFESGMFVDIKSAAQAVVKIQAGQEIGIPPFASMSGIHIIQGKPTIGAGLIASRIKGSGKYDYEVKEQTEKACSIDFYQGKKMIGNSTFTLDDAKKAGTKNLDKFPRNMLFARAISNGVKWFCPDVFAGPVYTPEEFEDVKIEDVPHEEIKPPVVKWIYTADLKHELTILAETATLDDNARFAAENSIENVKSEADYTKIKVRLIQLQTQPV